MAIASGRAKEELIAGHDDDSSPGSSSRVFCMLFFCHKRKRMSVVSLERNERALEYIPWSVTASSMLHCCGQERK